MRDKPLQRTAPRADADAEPVSQEGGLVRAPEVSVDIDSKGSMSLGPWIRSRRKTLGLNQMELGERLGLSQMQVSQWETLRMRCRRTTGDDDRPHDATGEDPAVQEPLRIHADGVKDEYGEHHQDAAAQGDEDHVDEPLPGEAHVVHALVMAPPGAARVPDSDGEPERHGQVKSRQHLRVSPGGERKEAPGQGAHDERRRQHPAASGVQARLPREEPGEEGEDEEAEVPDVEGLRGTPTVFEAQPEAVSYTHLTLPT